MELNQIDQLTHQSSSYELQKKQLLYPHERVVAFVAKYFPDLAANATKNAMDIGFGSGRHIKLFLDYNLQGHGIDYTEEAIALAKNAFGSHPQLRTLNLGDYRSYDNKIAFDLIVSWGVVFYSRYSEIKGNLLGIERLLKKGGRAFINFRAKENWFNGLGKELEPNSFLLDDRAKPYGNFLYTFVNEEQIYELIEGTGLKIDYIEKTTLRKGANKKEHAWYLCSLIKA